LYLGSRRGDVKNHKDKGAAALTFKTEKRVQKILEYLVTREGKWSKDAMVGVGPRVNESDVEQQLSERKKIWPLSLG